MKNQMKQSKGQKVPMWYNHNKKRGFWFLFTFFIRN